MKESFGLPQAEQQERRRQHEALESTSGFSRLSDDQKRYIEASLYVQQRAERGTDPISASRVQPMPKEFESAAPGRTYIASSDRAAVSDPSESKRYFTSQMQIMSDYCHQAIATLEGYAEQGSAASEWLDAGPITSFAELEELIDLNHAHGGLPYVIEIWHGEPGLKHSSRLHSTLLLGADHNGEMMVWEKAGLHLPFQLVPLKQVYAAYKNDNGWRVRPLKT